MDVSGFFYNNYLRIKFYKIYKQSVITEKNLISTKKILKIQLLNKNILKYSIVAQ